MEELIERLSLLETQVNRLGGMVNPEVHPFTYHMYEAQATAEQESAVFALMDQARASLSTEKPMHHAEFEQAIYGIFPSKNGDYHFAEGIVSTLNKTDQYDDVYAHMQQSGMNI